MSKISQRIENLTEEERTKIRQIIILFLLYGVIVFMVLIGSSVSASTLEDTGTTGTNFALTFTPSSSYGVKAIRIEANPMAGDGGTYSPYFTESYLNGITWTNDYMGGICETASTGFDNKGACIKENGGTKGFVYTGYDGTGFVFENDYGFSVSSGVPVSFTLVGTWNSDWGYSGAFNFSTAKDFSVFSDYSTAPAVVPASTVLTAPTASSTQDFTSWLFDFSVGDEYSTILPAKYFQYVVDYGVSTSTLNNHDNIQEIFITPISQATGTTTSQVPKTKALIEGETYYAQVRLQIAKVGVGEIEYQNIATSSIVAFTISETGIEDTRADFNGTLYIPDIPTSTTSGVSTSSPFYLDCSMYTFSATGTDMYPMFEYVDVFGVDLIPVPTSNFFNGVVCYAKVPVYEVLSFLFVPHNFSVNIWNGSINKMKTVFPFKLYFETMDSIKTYMGENSTSSASVAITLPAPKSGLSPMTMTFLSSTTLINTIGATSTQAWFTGFSSLLWILFLIIVIKVLYEIFDENDQDI